MPGALSLYQGLVCTSDRISRDILCWKSCNHNRLTLQNQPICSWQVPQAIFSRITLLLEAKLPEMMMLYSLLSLSHPHNTSLPELQMGNWWEAPCSASPKLCLAAAHHHSCHRRGCGTLPAVRKTGRASRCQYCSPALES